MATASMTAPSPTRGRRPPAPPRPARAAAALVTTTSRPHNGLWGRVRSGAVVLVLAVVLAACGDDGGDSSAPVSSSSTTTTVLAPPVTAPAIGTQSGRLDALPDATVVAPVALRIPSLGIDAPVRAVGVDAAGDMEVPAATDVGWYRFGPAPGAEGSAVLAAHVDYDGRRGVFFELGQLQPGARVEVVLADGSVQGYEVERLAQIPKGDLAASGVFDRTGPARLALITCGGSFDADARSYRDNVVAYAVPVPAAAT